MAKWHLTRRAVDDLDSIWQYTVRKWSEQQADLYYNGLVAEFQMVVTAQNNFDREYAEIRKGIFGHHYRKHLIFYRKTDNGDVLIIRILHEQMDIKSKFI